MPDFPEYVFEQAVAGLRAAPEDARPDVYVVSFFVYDEDDDPRLPVLTIGTNSETQVRLASDPPPDFVHPNPWWTPTDQQEARWNYAFWLQDELTRIGDGNADAVGAELRERWFRDTGLWFEGDLSDETEEIAEDMTRQFVALCVAAVQRIHAAGITEEIFGRRLPVIVHELEYYDEIAEQNVAANGPELAAGLVDWISSM